MAKNTHAFQNDIKHYGKIRDILRYLYMFGSSSKEELVKKNLVKSISSFYDIRQRIENYIDGEYLQEHKSTEKVGTGKKFRFMYDPFRCPVNYLAETYQNCSFVTDDIIFYFCLMQAFVDPDYPECPYEYLDNNFLIDDETIETDDNVAVTDLVTIVKNIYKNNQDILEELNGTPVYNFFNKKMPHKAFCCIMNLIKTLQRIVTLYDKLIIQ